MASRVVSSEYGKEGARGGAVTLAGQGVRFAVQMIGLIVLARMLTPTDFGIYAMVAVFVMLGEIVRDGGLLNAAIQTPKLPRPVRDGLFWTNVALGIVLCVLMVLAAPVIADFYNQPAVADVAVGISAIFVLNGMATQYRASLLRSLKFRQLAFVDALAPALGLALATILAAFEYGYWALVAQQIATALIGLIAVIGMSRWRPRRGAGPRELKSLYRYGANLLGSQVIAFAGRNLDTVVIGASAGASQLGLYDRAYQFSTTPVNQLQAPISRVAVPILSRLQADRLAFIRLLARGQRTLAHVVLAPLALAAALAPALFTIVLGTAWTTAAVYFQLLVVAAATRVAGYYTYWLALSTGRTDISLRTSLVATPLLIVGMVVGSHWGALGVAAGVAGASILAWPIATLIYSRYTDLPVWALWRQGARILASYAVAALVGSLCSKSWNGNESSIQAALLGAVAYVATVALCALMMRGFRSDWGEIAQVARTALSRAK